MEENKKGFITWVKAHKNELIIAGVTVVGTVLVVKNWDSIKGLFKATEAVVPDISKIEPVAEEIVVPIISSDILENLTGNGPMSRFSAS